MFKVGYPKIILNLTYTVSMPLRVDPSGFQEKHARRLKGALDDMRKGVERVSVAPTAQAAEKVEKMKAKLDEAFASGKVERTLKAVSLEDWKKDMLEKGVGRVSGGIDRAKDKVTSFATALLPKVESAQGAIKGMPDLTLDDNLARLDKYIREMAKFKYK